MPWSLIKLVLARPGLWIPLLKAGWAFRARDWYRTPPFLPLPPVRYVQWRMETAFGSADATPTPEELKRFLEWSEQLRKTM